ncbi:MAG: hypothetical protein WC635_12925 [Bacteriovorax sp.]|jgi:hypothetical protein
MTESLQLYFEAFKDFAKNRGERRITYMEVMGISWALHIVYAFYSIFALYLGVKSYDYFSSSKDFSHLVLESFSFKLQKASMLSILFGVIFYPFIFQFAYKFWQALFKFYINLFECNDEVIEEKADEILSSAFSGNLFLMFPIIGNVLSNIAFYFFLYQGLKRKYNFTSLQASLVLITPLFLMFLIAVFSASYFLFLFTLF